MLKLKKQTSGFTIVELLIVIVVIGILAALVITTYAGIQSKARNAHRQSDIQSLQTQIEAFYSQQGYYPSNTDLNSPTWRTTNMKSLDAQALVDPSNTSATCSGTTQTTCMATTPAPKTYAYVAKDSTGSTANCESNDTTCVTYTLTATLEGGTTYAKSNLD